MTGVQTCALPISMAEFNFKDYLFNKGFSFTNEGKEQFFHKEGNSNKIIIKTYDICDELVGIYPKDFQWSGFHVLCKCFRTTILKSTDELISELNEGLNLPPESSKNHVS